MTTTTTTTLRIPFLLLVLTILIATIHGEIVSLVPEVITDFSCNGHAQCFYTYSGVSQSLGRKRDAQLENFHGCNRNGLNLIFLCNCTNHPGDEGVIFSFIVVCQNGYQRVTFYNGLDCLPQNLATTMDMPIEKCIPIDALKTIGTPPNGADGLHIFMDIQCCPNPPEIVCLEHNGACGLRNNIPLRTCVRVPDIPEVRYMFLTCEYYGALGSNFTISTFANQTNIVYYSDPNCDQTNFPNPPTVPTAIASQAIPINTCSLVDPQLSLTERFRIETCPSRTGGCPIVVGPPPPPGAPPPPPQPPPIPPGVFQCNVLPGCENVTPILSALVLNQCLDVHFSAFPFWKLVYCDPDIIIVETWSGVGCTVSRLLRTLSNHACSFSHFIDCNCPAGLLPPPPEICPQTCVRPPSFWAQHNSDATEFNFITDWPVFTTTTQFCTLPAVTCLGVCPGVSTIDLVTILQADPDGDAWLVLAKQVISTLLNRACTDIITLVEEGFDVANFLYSSELLQAEVLLGAQICNRPIFLGPVFNTMVALAQTLNAYNNGTCDGCFQELCEDGCFYSIGEDLTPIFLFGNEPICPRNCSRPPSYWATHFVSNENPNFNLTWPTQFTPDTAICTLLLLPAAPCPLCTNATVNQTALDILQLDADGDAWVVLAKQYITFLLNLNCSSLEKVPTGFCNVTSGNTSACDLFPLLSNVTIGQCSAITVTGNLVRYVDVTCINDQPNTAIFSNPICTVAVEPTQAFDPNVCEQVDASSIWLRFRCCELTTLIDPAKLFLSTRICDRPILAGDPDYDAMIALAITLNGFNNGTSNSTSAFPLCGDTCPYNISADIEVPTIPVPSLLCAGCVRSTDYFRHHHGCLERDSTSPLSNNISRCNASCPWPLFHSWTKCVAKMNVTLAALELQVPLETTRWCDSVSVVDSPPMGESWLEVLQRDPVVLLSDEDENEDRGIEDDNIRIKIAQNYITAILNVLNCACDCPTANVAALAACDALEHNITLIDRFFNTRPRRRCPARSAVTDEIVAISDGMERWSSGLTLADGRLCTTDEFKCRREPIVVNTRQLLHGEAHLIGKRPEIEERQRKKP